MKFKYLILAALWVLISAGSAFAAGAVIGKITFEGQPPAPEKIAMTQDPYCQAAHAEAALAETVVVNGNGTLKNVFVYIKEGLEGQTFETPKDAVIFDQAACIYKPHVFGVQVNQPIEIQNSDPTLHNVHAVAEKNRGFNLGMPIKGMKLKKSFSSPEVMVKFKCDVHPWMSAYAGVLDHPFFAVSGEDGAFKIENLPAGTYTLEAWHEKFGPQTQQVTVGEGESKEADFSYKSS